MSIPIGIKNLTSSALYIKEIQVEVPANQTFFIGEYDFFTLAEAQSLKDAITTDQAFLVRDGVVLSKADSLAYVTTPPSTLGEINTASNVGTGAGVFKQKTGVDLEFKSLIAGTNINLTSGTDDITIDSAAGASFGYDKTKNAYYFAGTNRVDYAYRTNGAVNANVMNVIGFNIYGQVELDSLSIDATSVLAANLIACVYKYDYATNNWTLVAQSTPYTTGISGLQTYTLASTVSMENGLYFAGILSDANATNLSGIQANGLYNAFGYATTPLNLAAVDKWYKYNLTYTTTLPATITGYPTGFIRQTSGNVAIPLLKFN